MNIAAMRRSSGDAESTSLLTLREFIEGVGGSELYAYENPVEPVPLRLDDGIFRSSAAYRLGDISGNGVMGAEDAAFALDIATTRRTPAGSDEAVLSFDNIIIEAGEVYSVFALNVLAELKALAVPPFATAGEAQVRVAHASPDRAGTDRDATTAL